MYIVPVGVRYELIPPIDPYLNKGLKLINYHTHSTNRNRHLEDFSRYWRASSGEVLPS